MNDQTLFRLVREADPLRGAEREAAPTHHLQRILTEGRPEAPRRSRLSRTRLALVGGILALAAAMAGLGAAASGWLQGSPAPSNVVSDFQAYTPQLGFHPDPGAAVLVAEDDQISLYATTNREGSYCLVVNAPWKPSTTLDGGTCVPEALATKGLIAGILGAAANTPDGGSTLVVGGRIDNTDARTIRFLAPSGSVLDRPVGPSGFFVAEVKIDGGPCESGGWNSTFTALDANGNQVGQTTIPLTESPQAGVCMLSFLRG